MRIMAVDYGAVRTGIAVCDEAEMLASPVEVITEYHEEKLCGRIAEEAKKLRAAHIVMGLPKNMDGSEGESAAKVRRLADKVRTETGLEVSLWDERRTTVEAHGILSANDVRGGKRKKVVDSVAAAVILEGFLMSRRNKRSAENAGKEKNL